MQLTPDRYEQLIDALALAFPTAAMLRMFVRLGLNANIEELVAPGTLREQIAGLIDAREAHGPDSVIAFVQTAHDANPENPELATAAAQIDASWFAAAARPAPAARPAGGSSTTVNTEGGAYIGGNVTAGRNFVGRDQTIRGDD